MKTITNYAVNKDMTPVNEVARMKEALKAFKATYTPEDLRARNGTEKLNKATRP